VTNPITRNHRVRSYVAREKTRGTPSLDRGPTGCTQTRKVEDDAAELVQAVQVSEHRLRTGSPLIVLVSIVVGLEGLDLIHELADLGFQFADAALSLAILGFRLGFGSASLGLDL